MNETFEFIKMFAQFPFALRPFMQVRMSPERAREILRTRLAHRSENFLRVLEHAVYGHSASPYRALMEHAGLGWAEARAAVESRGVEGALREWRAREVYVTFEEFKGRKPIVRGDLTLTVKPRDFDNPLAARHFTAHTGGTTGAASSVYANLDHVAATAPHLALLLEAHQVRCAPAAIGVPILPGGGFYFVLQRVLLRERVDRWYTAMGWRDSRYWMKYGLANLYLWFWVNVFGARVPLPEYVKPNDSGRIAAWISHALAQEGRAFYFGTATLALRACLAAVEARMDWRGVTLRVGGEPVTQAKVNAMQSTGARVFPGYGMTESGSIGMACLNPSAVDDVHIATDAFAIYSHPHIAPGADVTVPALYLSTLLETSPKILLNLMTDDYGDLQERACGCPIEAAGYSLHLGNIRSYSKLLGEAVTLIGNDMVRILEETLPARFGGSSLDYQLLEQEDALGFTRVYLVIHPRIAIADEQAVIECVWEAMREFSPNADATRVVWQNAGTLRIKRAEPQFTARGKFMPLQVERKK